jgi:hypothetical protein
MVKGRELAVFVTCLVAVLALVMDSQVVSAGSTSLMVASKESSTEAYYGSNTGPAFDGIILGGSNSVYGLSAAILDEQLHEKWANLGMYGWYGSFGLFKKYISDLAKKPKFKKIKTIVISDIRFATQEVPAESRDQLTRVSSDRLLPRASVLSVLTGRAQIFAKTTPRLFDSKNGDLNYHNSPEIACVSDVAAWDSVSREVQISADNLLAQHRLVRSVFPEADILFLVPPVLSFGLTSKQSREWRDDLRNYINKVVERSSRPSLLAAVYLNQRDLYCDSPWHLNRLGRQKLSLTLSRLIRSSRSKKTH